MAELLICMADMGRPDRPDEDSALKTGDILWDAGDGHEWGDHEDFDKFKAAGYTDWHGRLAVVKMPLMVRADARALRVPLLGSDGKVIRDARYHFDMAQLERRIPAPDRPTVFRDFKIIRPDTNGAGLIVDRDTVADKANVNLLRKP